VSRAKELQLEEEKSDLLAAAGDFRGASRVMRWVNQQRAELLGVPWNRSLDPNWLRERANALEGE
jgi:hypothetical protein